MEEHKDRPHNEMDAELGKLHEKWAPAWPDEGLRDLQKYMDKKHEKGGGR